MSPALRPGDGRLIIGGAPRADLLPPSVRQADAARKQRGLLAVILVAVILVVGGAYAATSVLAAVAQTELAAANERTSSLLLEKGKYSEVTQIQLDLDEANAAVAVGSSTDLDWEALLKNLDRRLPEGATIMSAVAEVSTPVAAIGQPGSILYGPRVADIKLTLATKEFRDVPEFLRAVTDIPGFADVVPEGTTVENDDHFETTLSIHLNSDALVSAVAAGEANNE